MAPIKYELELFAGGGGGILGGDLVGRRCVGAVEIEPAPRSIILGRQRDGSLPWFPLWDDIRTFRSDNPDCEEFFELMRRIAPWLCIAGGFPCQDISLAGGGAGLDGERSGLWHEMLRVIREIGPAGVRVENSAALLSRGIGTVLGQLAQVGFDARWGVLSAADAIWLGGYPAVDHIRDRAWIIGRNRAYPNGLRQQ